MLYRKPRKGDIVQHVKFLSDVLVCPFDRAFDHFPKEEWQFVTVVPEVRHPDSFVNLYKYPDGFVYVSCSYRSVDKAKSSGRCVSDLVGRLNLANYVGVFDE